jgi:hypothetical protein
MKKILGMALLAACLFVSSPATMNAATSSLDNVPGGAGLAYWQAGGGWQTLINIQEVHGSCADVHVGIYDSNDTRVRNFNLYLRPRDNIGVVISGDGANILLYDYSDDAFGGTSVLNDVSTGPAVTAAAPAGPDGIQRGYVSVVRNNTGCGGAGGAPSGNITDTYFIVPDYLLVRAAYLNPNSAFALNAAMLQGFANQGPNLAEDSDFVSSTTTPNSRRDCDVNRDGDTIDEFTKVDDTIGADIDFLELFLSDNVSVIGGYTTWIICNPGNFMHRALGSSTSGYWARYNENASSGTESILVLIAPQSLHPSAAAFSRELSGVSYDDNGNYANWNIGTIAPVAAIPFGPGGIPLVSGATAGDANFDLDPPMFGFSFTETASIADLYPIAREAVSIFSLNEDHVDDAVDIITIP